MAVRKGMAAFYACYWFEQIQKESQDSAHCCENLYWIPHESIGSPRDIQTDERHKNSRLHDEFGELLDQIPPHAETSVSDAVQECIAREHHRIQSALVQATRSDQDCATKLNITSRMQPLSPEIVRASGALTASLLWSMHV